MRRVLAWLAVAALLAAQADGWTPAAQDAPPAHAIRGWVEDAVGRLPGAEVRLVELNRSTITDAEGAFAFDALPGGRYTLGVHLPGYASVHRAVSLPEPAPIVVRLELDWRVQEEVTVTAAPWAVRPLEAAQAVTVVDTDEARREGTASLGGALEAIPGLANISTGNALGTPVIRGIAESRIRVLNDGVALNHQQFSSRHSPNVEPGLAERIEVVRGPASVLYGPEAMGGVINVVQAPLPTAHGAPAVVHGRVQAGYGGGADEMVGQAVVEGAAGGLGWRAGVVRRDAGDLGTPDGPLTHTWFGQTNVAAAVGAGGERGRWRGRWHHWSNAQAFHQPPGFRLDLDDDLVAADAEVPTRAGDVEASASWQRNVRKAFPAWLGGAAAEDLVLTTMQGRAGLRLAERGPFRGRVAVEYQGVANRQRVPGVLLPDYDQRTGAVMVYEEARLARGATFDRLILSGGARWDVQRLRVPPDVTRDLPDGYRRSYSSLCGSLGAVVRLGQPLAIAASLGRGWRAPNAFELFANGVHGGVAAVQIGNRDLETESNLAADVSLRLEARRARASLTVYRNAVDRFVYLADTGETWDTPDGTLPVFVYRQAPALLRGVEADMEVAVRPWLTLAANASRVLTKNRATGARLPQTPPDRFGLALRWQADRIRAVLMPYAELAVVASGRGRVSGPDEPFGTPTSPWARLDLRTGGGWTIGGAFVGLDFGATNLLDARYTDFLWTYKPWAPSPGRDVRLTARLAF